MITVCTESTIKVWEIEAGRLVYQIVEPHGTTTEVTALALDKTGYRMATGAQGGMCEQDDLFLNKSYFIYSFARLIYLQILSGFYNAISKM